MVVCTFYQQNRCRFGDRCKYEHPGRAGSGNSFAALAGGFQQGRQGQAQNQGQQNQQTAKYGLTVSDIKIDLTAGKGRPEWIFSCYGPGRNAPRQLFGGPQREMSFEELRLHHYELAAAGNAQGAVQEAQNMYAEHVKQMEIILGDLDGAIKYVIDGENEHPNRIDIAEGKTVLSFSGLGKSPFGKPEEPAPPQEQMSGFGKLAQPGFGKPSGFGQPSFGQPSFGQSSFGQPSAAGQAAFEKPAFGQPSFGQPAMGTTGFAVPQNTESPFAQMANKYQGQNTGFGQSASSASPFAQINQQPQPPLQPQPQPQAAAPSGFGFVKQPEQPAQPPNPFGQPVTAPTQSFGTLQPQQPPQQQAQNQTQTPALGANMGAPTSIKVDDPNDLMPIPPLNGQTTRDPMTNKLTSWKGQPVKYLDNVPCYLHPQDQKTWARIFFPDGPPDEASLRDAYGEPDEYTPEVAEQYEFFAKNGYFKDGIIPSVPPKRENVSFDF